jgi:hypothetical protein
MEIPLIAPVYVKRKLDFLLGEEVTKPDESFGSHGFLI